MAEEQHTFSDADGIEVAYRRWPAEHARGAVVVVHGASEHSGRYARFADALTAAGWTVLAPDNRGHGATARSTGPGRPGPRGFVAVLDDVHEVVLRAYQDFHDGPVVLFGHSLGSIIALRYAQARAPLAGLVLSGPIGAMPGAADAAAQLAGAVEAGLGDRPMDALGPFNDAFEPARTPFDWLSRDTAEVDKYLADPLCGDDLPLTHEYMAGAFAMVRDELAQLDLLPRDLPVLLTAGERDPVGGFTEYVRRLAGSMRGRGMTVAERYYPDARHEILNETNRDEVTADIIKWLTTATTVGGTGGLQRG
jgi:alpha-beta hydrolase superfamily lysophospholipase